MRSAGKKIYRKSPEVSEEVRINRALLTEAMAGRGFYPFPAEFWHHSLGDREEAWAHGKSHAIYGPLGPEDVRRMVKLPKSKRF